MAASEVAEHYNSRRAVDRKARRQSPILRLRNFNNWIKATLLQEATALCRDGRGKPEAALDLCCGKGGDLFKWRVAGVQRLVLVDIARESVEVCKSKFEQIFWSRTRSLQPAFLVADCAQERLDALPEVAFAAPFDIVSCQFALHYAFESLPRAETMLKNATTLLRSGGIFVGTIPDSNTLLKRLRRSPDGTLKNSKYSVTPMFPVHETPPLFGAKYNFYLDEVVGCPEFLVHFELFVELASRYGLELVKCANFADYFIEQKENSENRELLRRMDAFQTVYRDETEPNGRYEDYEHAKKHFQTHGQGPIETMSPEEWEVASLYLVFIFKKITEVTR